MDDSFHGPKRTLDVIHRIQVSTLLIVLLNFDTREFQLGLKEHREPDNSCEGDPLGRLNVR